MIVRTKKTVQTTVKTTIESDAILRFDTMVVSGKNFLRLQGGFGLEYNLEESLWVSDDEAVLKLGDKYVARIAIE